jgi:putative oxidoreductase
MKIAYLVGRVLLGLVMLVFGLNVYLQFMPAGQLPPGPLADFNHALFTSHYIYAIGVFQVVPGILLLLNRYVPLALALLAPVIVNICFIHIFMAPSGLPLAAVVGCLQRDFQEEPSRSDLRVLGCGYSPAPIELGQAYDSLPLSRTCSL